MESALLVALSHASVVRRQMDVVANNIANVNTTGFRQQFVVTETDHGSKPGKNPIDFVTTRAVYNDFSSGELTQTGNDLDVAIQGKGWFSVTGPKGETLYTRAGALKLDADGQIVNGHGQIVQGNGGGAIVIPTDAKQITVAKDGTISADGSAIGQLNIVEFVNEQSLEPVENGLFRSKEAGVAPTDTKVVQGFLEGSNVKPVVEMTRMIEVSRSYQSAMRLIDSENERLRNAIRAIARVT